MAKTPKSARKDKRPAPKRKRKSGGKKSGKKPARALPQAANALPFLQVMGQMHPQLRPHVIGRLGNDAVDDLSRCFDLVLKEAASQSSRLPPQLKGELKESVLRHRAEFKHVLTAKATLARKRALAQLCGNPLALILSAAIPLLLNLVSPK